MPPTCFSPYLHAHKNVPKPHVKAILFTLSQTGLHLIPKHKDDVQSECTEQKVCTLKQAAPRRLLFSLPQSGGVQAPQRQDVSSTKAPGSCTFIMRGRGQMDRRSASSCPVLHIYISLVMLVLALQGGHVEDSLAEGLTHNTTRPCYRIIHDQYILCTRYLYFVQIRRACLGENRCHPSMCHHGLVTALEMEALAGD